MRRRLDNDEWLELLREPDEFKLAIRGQTAIESEIDAAIAASFDGPVPRELDPASRFQIRLALLVGLGIVPQQWKPMFEELARVRNDFAHGKINELDAKRARALVVASRLESPIPPEWRRLEEGLKMEPPLLSLRHTLMTARVVILHLVRLSKEARQREQEIVNEYYESKIAGSPLLRALLVPEEPGEERT